MCPGASLHRVWDHRDCELQQGLYCSYPAHCGEGETQVCNRNPDSLRVTLRWISPASPSMKLRGWKHSTPQATVSSASWLQVAPRVSSPGYMKHPQDLLLGPEQSWVPCLLTSPPQESPSSSEG